ncbi:MAG: hypothetical protein AAGM38_12860 [Pseudomonadota bacterium]
MIEFAAQSRRLARLAALILATASLAACADQVSLRKALSGDAAAERGGEERLDAWVRDATTQEATTQEATTQEATSQNARGGSVAAERTDRDAAFGGDAAAERDAETDLGAESESEPRPTPREALARAASTGALGRRRASGPPDARDRAVWAACRPQVIAERCMAFEPTSDAAARAFTGWRKRHERKLEGLYRFIAGRGGLYFGDIDRTPLTRRVGDARTQSDVTHETVMLRYCDNAAKFFNGDRGGNFSFPTIDEAFAEARREGARAAAPGAVAAVRAACQTPTPEELG